MKDHTCDLLLSSVSRALGVGGGEKYVAYKGVGRPLFDFGSLGMSGQRGSRWAAEPNGSASDKVVRAYLTSIGSRQSVAEIANVMSWCCKGSRC